MDNEQHVERKRTLKISDAMKRAMLLYSKQIPGCPRGNDGSMNHFARYAFLEILKKHGYDMKKYYPGCY